MRYCQTCKPLWGGNRRQHLEAYELAFQTDPTSAFGGIIALNRELDEKYGQTYY